MIDDETKRVSAVLAASGFGGLIVGVVRGVIQNRHQGWRGFVVGALASSFVAVMVGSGLDSSRMATSLKLFIIGLCCFLADDVLLALTTLGKLASSDPLGFLARFRRAWTGAKPPTDEAPK